MSILIHRFLWCYDGFWWSKKCTICDLFSKSHHNDGTKISEKPKFLIKFSKKTQKYNTMKPLKNQNLTQNPPTCQNHPKMMAKNLQVSIKYSKSTYKGGNKSAKFVILSQKSKTQNVGSNWGKNLRKSNILG